MRLRVIAMGLLACHCGGAIPVQMVRVPGAGDVVPWGKSEALERAALEQRAARDLGCDAPALERSKTPVPLFRASGCGKHRVYVRAVRGWLPSPTAEIRVIDFVDVARADPVAPFAGVPRLPGEVETTPYPGTFDPQERGSVHGEGWDAALERHELQDRLTLTVIAAKAAACSRDEAVPWQGEWPKRAPFVEVCGRFLSYGRTGSPAGVPHEEEPWSSMGPDWRDDREKEVGFVPWSSSPPGYAGPNATVLHVTAAEPGLVSIGIAPPDTPTDDPPDAVGEPEPQVSRFRPICQPPCDLSVDGAALFRVLPAPRTSAVRPSAFFRLPRDRAAVTAHVSPARYANVVLGGVLLGVTPLPALAGGLTFSEASSGTARTVAGVGLIGASAALAVVGLFLLLQSTTVTVE